jgi:hypothetical protein
MGRSALLAGSCTTNLLLHQVCTLVIYKSLAEQAGINSDEPECTAVAFEIWLVKYHRKWLGITILMLAGWLSEHEHDWASMSFSWPGQIYAVEVQTPPISFKASKSPPCSWAFILY